MFAKRKFWIEYAINDCDDQLGIEDLSKLNKIRFRTPNARPPKIMRKKLNGVKPTLTNKHPALETCQAAVVAKIHISKINKMAIQTDIPIVTAIVPIKTKPPILPNRAER